MPGQHLQREAAMRRKASAYVQFKARMKEELRAKLERAAKEHGVSINAELVRRLEASFTQESVEALVERVGGYLDQAGISRGVKR
jgi:hypothetical protein